MSYVLRYFFIFNNILRLTILYSMSYYFARLTSDDIILTGPPQYFMLTMLIYWNL